MKGRRPHRAWRDDWRFVDGLWTHAQVWGEGPPLVIVPGIGCAAFVYAPLARELASHFTVWVYEPPGHGRSQARPGDHLTFPRLTGHLAAWLEAAGLPPACIVGHSLGGEVAIDLCARFPRVASALVLLAPTGVPENPSVTGQVLRMVLDAPREQPGLLLRVAASYLRCGPTRFFAIAGDQDRHKTVPLLPRVRAQTLIVSARQDHVIPAGAVPTLCRFMPHARAEQLGGAHAFCYDHAPEVAHLIVDFARFLRPCHATPTAH